jgi:hypothetical protein
MAIKGKGKTRARPPARAPRPVPVVRKPPFFLRRWVQVVGALLLGMLAVVVVVWATNGLRASDAEEQAAAADENARRAIQEWQTTVEGALATVGTADEGTGGFIVQPELSASVDTLSKGDADKGAPETADAAVAALGDAADTLEGVDLAALIRDRGLDAVTANVVLNSREKMLSGLQLYGRVASMVRDATAERVDPAVAEALIAEAADLLPLAKRAFDDGYVDYTSALTTVNLFQPTVPGAPGLPGSELGGVPGSELGGLPGAPPT